MTIKKSLLAAATATTVAIAGTGIASAADDTSSSSDLSSSSESSSDSDTSASLESSSESFDDTFGSFDDSGDFDWATAVTGAAAATTVLTAVYYAGASVSALIGAGDDINGVVTDTTNYVNSLLGQ